VYDVEVIEGVRDLEAEDPSLLQGLERVREAEWEGFEVPSFPEPPTEERLRRAERLRARALQAAVVRDRDAVLRLAIVGLLAAGGWAERGEDGEAVLAPEVAEAVTALAHAAGAVSVEELVASEEPGERRPARREDLYLRLVPVPRRKLEAAFRALVAASVAGWAGRGEPRLESPRLACRVAEDLRVGVGGWRPSAEYFGEYSLEELEGVARGVGVEVSEGLPRKELVERVVEALLEVESVGEYVPPELVFWDGRTGTGEGRSS
jgi:hypothetical protein